MRRRAVVYLCVLAGALGAIWLPTSAQGPGGGAVERVGGRDVVAREALVRFRRAPSATDLEALRGGDIDAESVTAVGRAGAHRVRSRSVNAAGLVARLARRGDVLYAEPNYILRVDAAPNDPSFPSLWGLENLGQPVAGVPGVPGADIHATAAWDVSTGSPNTVVAVIDTGIDYTHQDLAANVWAAPASFSVDVGGSVVTCPAGSHGFNAILRTCDPMDDHNHGTHVAGTVGAVGNNQVGVVGVNWTTRIMGIKFLDAAGSGNTADAIASVRFAIEAKQAFAASEGANVRVLSSSWGGGDFSQALLDEINAANQADMLFVAAAGNSGMDNDMFPHYPSSYAADNVVAVAATNNFDQRAWFSNYGKQSVHLAAPGDNILSTTIGNTYGASSGTSMATPHVSGAAALVLSVCQLDTAALKEALIGTVDAVAGLATRTITGGRLNVHSAVHSCLGPPPTPVNLSAEAGDNRVTLSWTSSLGATRYIVKRATTSGGPYTTIAPNVIGAAYIDTSAVNETTYYYVVSAANSLGVSDDSDEASATPHAPSDLKISGMQMPPPAGAGTSFTITITTQNFGLGASGPTTTAIYLSDNALFGATDQRLFDVEIGALAPGASVTSTATITVPSELPAGSYFVVGVADADQDEAEKSEINNTSARALNVGPDLEITALTVPGSAGPGGVVSVASTVENEGGGAAGAFAVTFYLSANTTLDASDTLLSGSRGVSGLAAGAASAGPTNVTIPPNTSVGTYNVIAKADGLNEVAESLENNNTTSRTIKIGGDLVVSSLTAPAMAGAGAVISVGDTTTNPGSATVAASTTRFYLSSNTQFDAGDVQLDGSHAVPQLEASAASTATTPVTIPAGTLSGAYYLIAVADAAGVVAETSESNNTEWRSIQIGTDLVVSAFTVPAKGGAGLPLAISETTRNQGTGTAAASITRYFLSTNSTFDAADQALTPDHGVPQLDAGIGHSASLSIAIPPNTPAGSYYLIAKADTTGAVTETNEGNNTLSRSIQIGGDLAVSTLTAPAKAGAGSTVTVSDTTINQGAGPVAASGTRFYLSANIVLDAGDTLLAGTHSVPALDAGLSHAASTTVTIPASQPTGAYYLIATADGNSLVPETSESNNTKYRSVQIGPDLEVSTLSGPSKIGAGLPFVVTDTTVNQGGGGADATTVAFYLSTDWVYDAADTSLNISRPIPALAAGGISSAQTTLTVPPGTAAGAYYILAKVDPQNAIPETNETDNAEFLAVKVGPDLLVKTFWLSPTKGVAGSTVTGNDTVQNQGGAAAGASTLRFYFSTNNTLDASDTPAGERPIPALAAGASNSATFALQIPPGTPAGNYYFLAQADAYGVVAESPETNNVTSAPIQVTIVP